MAVVASMHISHEAISEYYRIDPDGVIKVADFGLTEDMYGTNYFRRRKSVSGSEEKVPIRWMAPESIEDNMYTESSDVVSTILHDIVWMYKCFIPRMGFIMCSGHSVSQSGKYSLVVVSPTPESQP